MKKVDAKITVRRRKTEAPGENRPGPKTAKNDYPEDMAAPATGWRSTPNTGLTKSTGMTKYRTYQRRSGYGWPAPQQCFGGLSIRGNQEAREGGRGKGQNELRTTTPLGRKRSKVSTEREQTPLLLSPSAVSTATMRLAWTQGSDSPLPRSHLFPSHTLCATAGA